MMAHRSATEGRGSAAGPARHIPVLLDPVLEHLKPRAGALYIDGTFGAGGYSRAILAAADCRVLAIDRDPTALAAAAEWPEVTAGRLLLAEGVFSDMRQIAGEAGGIEFGPVAGVVLDVGVSSMQLDDAARGFSFQSDGPLDMRMSGEGQSAADVVNTASEQHLANILFQLGQERRSRAIARAIVAARTTTPFARTAELAQTVMGVLGPNRPGRRHPATRTFQALRIYVNDELAELARGLAAAEELLAPGGRLVVVSFHSLEDGIVKRFLTQRGRKAPRGSRHLPDVTDDSPAQSFRIVNSRPLTPDADEIAVNPRARSARLRAGERLDTEAHELDLHALGVPRPAD